MIKFKRLVLLRRYLLGLNFIAVMFNATLFSVCTNYILHEQASYELLTEVQHIPYSATDIFWETTVSFMSLAIVMTCHHYLQLSRSVLNLVVLAELILAVLVFLAIRMTYNGIFLLIFIDFFISHRNEERMRNYRVWLYFALLLIFTFSFTNYSILNRFFPMPSLNIYLSFLPAQLASWLTLFRNILTVLNLVTFLLIIIFYALYQLNREHQIQAELASAARANTELKNYVALSKRITQNRERKRIARDIHDTVGHALTGIAAGIDAVLVLIDVNPTAAKKQLQKISVAVKQGLKDVRKALNQIRPGALNNYTGALNNYTLEASLSKMLKEYAALSHLKIDFNYQWGSVNFEKTTEDVIFRIIEESVTNSLRHGHASKIQIDCIPKTNAYQLLIHNNGTSNPHFKPGFGLTQMKERVAIINGQISFNGQDGFTTKVEIPKEGGPND